MKHDLSLIHQERPEDEDDEVRREARRRLVASPSFMLDFSPGRLREILTLSTDAPIGRPRVKKR